MLKQKIRILTVTFFTSIFFLWSPFAHSQASVNISTLEPVYRDIDKLVAHGLIDRIIVGQKPYSRKEVARLTAEAMKNLHRLEDQLNDPQKKKSIQERLAYIYPILRRLKHDYHEELVQLGAVEGEKRQYSLHALEHAEIDALVTNSPQETLLPNNGLGGIDAVINPLVDYHEGRHFVEGGNLSLETTHWLRASDYFAMFVRPRFQLGLGFEEQNNDNTIRIMNLYGKFYFHNFELEVGRDNLVWGQGGHAGLLLSQNPRGLDMIKISNDSPFFLPWVFKYIGPVKFSFFYSNLGSNQNFPDAYLTGYKLTIEPASFLEMGLALYDQSGGQGSPAASIGDRVLDLFPFTQFQSGSKGQVQIGNKLGGIDFRLRIPPLRGSEVYGEIIFDDTHSDLYTEFVQDMGYVLGVYVPRMYDSGKLDLRLEYHRTGVRYYRHSQFTSGVTLNQFLIGDNLGPNAQAIYLKSEWDVSHQDLASFNIDFESRSSDIWGGSIDRFVVIQANPTEYRYRSTIDWLHRFSNLPLTLKGQLGYEHVQNFNWVQGRTQENFLGEVFLQFTFDQWTQFPKSSRAGSPLQLQ